MARERTSGPAVLPNEPLPSEYGMVTRPIPSATASWDTGQVAVGVIAVQVPPILVLRKAVGFRASCVAGAEIFIGNSNAVTTLTGTGLKDRETISLELDENAEVWAIATAGGQTLYVAEIG